jgi:hypothetical protein
LIGHVKPSRSDAVSSRYFAIQTTSAILFQRQNDDDDDEEEEEVSATF